VLRFLRRMAAAQREMDLPDRRMHAPHLPEIPLYDPDPSLSSVSISSTHGCGLTMWTTAACTVGETDCELRTQIEPHRPLVIGRQQGGETPYLDPQYRPTPMVPDTDGCILRASKEDIFVSRGHFMLKGSQRGVLLVNGVPRRGGGIRPPLNGTFMLAPTHRPMHQGEEFLIDKGSAAKIMLPNGAVLLINAE
jgi:hypothetical protein